jgi:hypothetical protein
MSYLIAISFWIFAIWLIRKDTREREGISPALWVPTIWVFVLLSRPLSSWIGMGGAEDTMEGSPADRSFYFGLIALSFIVVARRGLNLSATISRNWAVLLFYGYLLLTVLWADSSLVSFKRWLRILGMSLSRWSSSRSEIRNRLFARCLSVVRTFCCHYPSSSFAISPSWAVGIADPAIWRLRA